MSLELALQFSVNVIAHVCRVFSLTRNRVSCALKQLDNTVMTSTDCCQYGGAWRKSTSFSSCDLHESELHRIQHRCRGRHRRSRTQRLHSKLCDRARVNNG